MVLDVRIRNIQPHARTHGHGAFVHTAPSSQILGLLRLVDGLHGRVGRIEVADGTERILVPLRKLGAVGVPPLRRVKVFVFTSPLGRFWNPTRGRRAFRRSGVVRRAGIAAAESGAVDAAPPAAGAAMWLGLLLKTALVSIFIVAQHFFCTQPHRHACAGQIGGGYVARGFGHAAVSDLADHATG